MEEPKHQTVFDSDQQQVGETYANALIGFGQKNGNTETLLQQLGGIVDVLGGVPKLNAMLQSPGIGAGGENEICWKRRLEENWMGILMNFLEDRCAQ